MTKRRPTTVAVNVGMWTSFLHSLHRSDLLTYVGSSFSKNWQQFLLKLPSCGSNSRWSDRFLVFLENLSIFFQSLPGMIFQFKEQFLASLTVSAVPIHTPLFRAQKVRNRIRFAKSYANLAWNRYGNAYAPIRVMETEQSRESVHQTSLPLPPCPF